MQARIIKEGKDFLVVFKPPFVLSEKISPLICHRLDFETSGLLLVAKDKKSLKFLQKQFKERKVKKEYLAVVLGKFREKEVKVEGLLRRGDKKPFTFEPLVFVSQKEALDHKSFRVLGKKARYSFSFFKLISAKKITIFKDKKYQQFNFLSLIKAQPHTGRRHQIRVHLSHLGYPILGDKIYASKLSKKASKILDISHLQLFSVSLSFLTPQGKEERVSLKIKDLDLSCKVKKAFLS
ncbi:RNA pseudouridine synthase [bacterium]|nr:RNA pseudouridine synthase [bacterium]